MARKRRSPIAASLLQKSREAALNAVQAFNNPLATFKTEAFIVVMSIAYSDDADHQFRQADHRFRSMPITLEERRSIAALGGRVFGVEV